MELSFIIKCINILSLCDPEVKKLLHVEKLVYDIDYDLENYKEHFNPIDELILIEHVNIDLDFICNVLKPKKITYKHIDELFSMLCEFGYTKQVEFVLECKTDINLHYKNDLPLQLAIENGHLDVIKLLCSYGLIPSDYIMNIACQEGYYEIVRYLSEIDFIPDLGIVYAANRGHLDIVKYLHENCNKKIDTLCIKRAIYNNNINVVKYILQFKSVETYMIITALNSRNTSLIDLFFNYDSLTCDYGEILSSTILNKNFDKFLYTLETKNIESKYLNIAFENACVIDDIKIAKILSNRVTLTFEEQLYKAIVHNSKHITNFLLQMSGKNIVIENRMINMIVNRGYHDILKLLLNYGVKINVQMLYNSIKYKHSNITLLLLCNFKIPEKYKYKVLRIAVKYDNVNVIRMLLKLKILPTKKIVCIALSNNNLECIRMLNKFKKISFKLFIKNIKTMTIDTFSYLYNEMKISDGKIGKLVNMCIIHGKLEFLSSLPQILPYNASHLTLALQNKNYDVAKYIMNNDFEY